MTVRIDKLQQGAAQKQIAGGGHGYTQVKVRGHHICRSVMARFWVGVPRFPSLCMAYK
jgi:hypothetical protein